jgi:hypothetical protein
MVDAGKTVAESDPEVSEAVDFVEFYQQAARFFHALPLAKAAGKGVAAVVSPWNFPIAIPCGGIAAALAAGNTVILKPSSDAAHVARELCECFWRGGIDRDTVAVFSLFRQRRRPDPRRPCRRQCGDPYRRDRHRAGDVARFARDDAVCGNRWEERDDRHRRFPIVNRR